MQQPPPDSLARYSRQMILPGWGLEAQQRLAQSSVLVVGLGGLGSPAALYLAAAGVGTLGLAEMDTLEVHNLQRQIVHDTGAVGTPKLQSAVRRLRALNPEVHLVEHPEGVQVDNARALMRVYDVIVDGSDNFPTRYLVNDAAALEGKPLVYGSVFQFEGQVSVWDPARGGPCYRCLFPEMPRPGEVPNCDAAGVPGALCGVIGSWQALEALKLLSGLGASLMGTLRVFDASTGAVRSVRVKPDPDCPLCGKHPSLVALDPSAYDWSCSTETMSNTHEAPLEVDPKTAQALIQPAQPTPDAQRKPALLVDVREDFERAIALIEGSHHVPLAQLEDAAASLPDDRTLIVYCHHGMRSARGAKALRRRGLDARSLAGGIDRWALEIDPQLARY